MSIPGSRSLELAVRYSCCCGKMITERTLTNQIFYHILTANAELFIMLISQLRLSHQHNLLRKFALFSSNPCFGSRISCRNTYQCRQFSLWIFLYYTYILHGQVLSEFQPNIHPRNLLGAHDRVLQFTTSSNADFKKRCGYISTPPVRLSGVHSNN